MTRFPQIATGGGPRPPASASRNEIEDELRDHLACRQSELEAAGLPPDAAAAEAERQFGNPSRVARELFWLHNGDRIMTQRLMWVAVICVILGLMAALYMQSRQYRIMLEQQQALAAELAMKTQAALASVKDGMPTATLRLRVVDEDGKPRPGRKVEIQGAQSSTQLSGAKYSMTGTSDADGWIDVGPMPLGEYTAKDSYPELDRKQHYAFASGSIALFRAGEEKTADFIVPVLTRRTVTVARPNLPEGANHWGEPSWSAGDRVHFGSGGPLQFDEPIEILLARDAPLQLFLNIEVFPGSRSRRLTALRPSWPADALPADGEKIELGKIELVNGVPALANTSASAPATNDPAHD